MKVLPAEANTSINLHKCTKHLMFSAPFQMSSINYNQTIQSSQIKENLYKTAVFHILIKLSTL